MSIVTAGGRSLLPRSASSRWRSIGAAVAAILALPAARADVTTEQKLTIGLGGIFNIDSTTTEYTTSDKERRDSQLHCSGLMSMFCGHGTSEEITRLDRGLTWHLNPAKKTYIENPLPTAEDRAAARAHMQEVMAKLQQCQAKQPQAQQSVDRSKCDLSPPTVTVKDDGPRASIMGHDTQAHSIIIGQTCTNRENGDICEFRYTFDVWLTPDQIEGLAEQREYRRAYLKRMGLDESDEIMQGQVRKFMAQYADQLKELSSKAQNLKGTPLKTTFSFSMGGERCGQAQKAQSSQPSGSPPPSSSPTLPPTSVSGAAAAVGSKLFGSMFKKKDSAAAPADASASGAAGASAGPPMATLASFTVETTAIRPGAIAPTQFELPAGWTRQIPPPPKANDKAMNCGADAQSE